MAPTAPDKTHRLQSNKGSCRGSWRALHHFLSFFEEHFSQEGPFLGFFKSKAVPATTRTPAREIESVCVATALLMWPSGDPRTVESFTSGNWYVHTHSAVAFPPHGPLPLNGCLVSQQRRTFLTQSCVLLFYVCSTCRQVKAFGFQYVQVQPFELRPTF